MTLRFLLISAFLAVSMASGYAEPTAVGLWAAKDDDGFTTAWFLFSEKNNVFSARLVKGFKKPGDEKPPSPTCDQCPGNKKGARVMGLTLFWGMKRDGLHYSGGSVLDPRDGNVYHAKMDLSEDGNDLAVRGYMGIEMLGKTQVWKRLPEDAMKKEDIPKEVLAGDLRPDAVAEKAKPKKPKPPKSEDETTATEPK